MEQTISRTLKVLGFQKTDVSLKPEDVKGLFSAHASNLGFPSCSNETSIIHGKTGREWSVEFTKELLNKYGAD